MCFITLKHIFVTYFSANFIIMQSEQFNYLPILMQALLAIGFVVGTIFISGKLGPKRKSASKDKNFECGIESVGNARIPFSVKYFLVAILFVLFDVEVIFLYPWAINFKELGLEGMIKMIVFMALLLVGFFYIIKKKALEWE
ncbi:NADH dehydrogenase subunit A [Flavobacterium glycines]|uniref:NADH-quinone oxidoreductase subunit A n=2 Tax=Flavobacterium glycines TaxID=551990 RepID=A0A1G8LT79_9FLAO|nr:NADH dehydrogenase subunit A [Flavobacterium glycines]